ncbi:MAG: hypothetical protein QXQ57_06695 [Sulfolobales archaeon]
MKKLRRNVSETGISDPLKWILSLLYAAGGRSPSKIHIQKALFIASRYVEELRELLESAAYRMGPWSEEMNDMLEIARLNGLVSETKNELVLTETGTAKAENIWIKLDERYRRILTDVAKFVNSMSEDELLLYIYITYGYSEKSDVINKLIKRRKELATNMLLKGLVSTEMAAKIAGEPLPKFIEYLRKRGIKPFTAEISDIENADKL